MSEPVLAEAIVVQTVPVPAAARVLVEVVDLTEQLAEEGQCE